MENSRYHLEDAHRHRGALLDEASAAVILVHGRGDSAEGILELASLLDDAANTSRLAFLAPQATGNTWYPNSFLAPLEQNEPGISSGVHVIGRLVDKINAAEIPSSRILIGGFSQGACLASEFVARNPDRYGGLFVLSGGLIGNGEIPGREPPHDKTFDYPGDLAGTPVFMGCSDVDAHIPLSRFERSAKVLAELGADVTKKVYPGMGHTINDDEIAHLRRLVTELS